MAHPLRGETDPVQRQAAPPPSRGPGFLTRRRKKMGANARPDTTAGTRLLQAAALVLALATAAIGVAAAAALIGTRLTSLSLSALLIGLFLAVGFRRRVAARRDGESSPRAEPSRAPAPQGPPLPAEAGPQAEAALRSDIERLSDEVWALREALGHARALLEARRDVVFCTDMDGRLTYANEAFREAFGIGDEAMGQAFALPRPEPEDMAAEPLGAAALGRRDEAVMTRAGPRWFSFDAVPLREGTGDLSGFQHVGRDVTERREAEAALAHAKRAAEGASQAKSRMLATVAHEIRTPLAGVIGMAGLLLDSGLTPEQETYAKAARSSGEALMRLTDELLDVSRLEAGRLALDIGPVALAPLIEEVVELLAPRAHEKGLEIGWRVAPGAPVHVAADPARLRQVLLNLAGNAVKFTEAGGVAVVAGPERDDGAPGGVRIAIADTGPGLPEGFEARLFHEFEQGSAAGRRQGGAGLGLAISRRLVEAMGGEIGVESRPGAGATFTLILPAASESDRAPAAAPLAGRRALVLTAGAMEGALLCALLEDLGAAAELLSGPEMIEDVAGVGTSDLVLADLAAIRAFAADGLAAATLAERAIVLVGPSERESLPEAAAQGFRSYLVRPVRPESLWRVALGEVDRDERGEPCRAPAAAMAQVRPARPLRVLLAEDNDINALLARTLLERAGHEVVRVCDGQAAVEAVATAEAPFDLVLMDLQMPVLDGIAATRAIRSGEHGAGVPIVALTANAPEEDREACARAGMEGHLQKPLEEAALTALLGRLGAACLEDQPSL